MTIEIAMATETGSAHGEHVRSLLEITPPEKRSALIESGRIRLINFMRDNGATAEAIAVARTTFDSAVSSSAQ